MRKPFRILLLPCLLSLALCWPANTTYAAVTPQDRLYVVLADDADVPDDAGAVVVFSVDAQGHLQQEGTYSTEGYIRLGDSSSYPSVDAMHGRLFVANNFSNDVSVFTIQGDGSIEAVPGSPFPAGDGSTFTALHPSGDFLYVTQWRESTIGVYEVSEFGQLTPLQTVVAFWPRLLEMAPSGEFLYAADMAVGVRAYGVSQNGTLAELAGSPVAYPDMSRPMFLELSSDGRMLFILDLDEGIASYTIDESGIPSVVPGSPFWFGSFGSKLALTHDDRFIYALSYDHIYGFEVMPDGSLQQLPDSPHPFEFYWPWLLINPPDESWLYAGKMAGKSLWMHSICPDGTLEESAQLVEVSDPADRWPNGAVYYRPASGCVDVDIKPGSDINPVNPRSHGVVPVALLGGDEYEVTDVDITSLRFGPGEAAPAHNLESQFTYNEHLQDVDCDGFLDLMIHFPTQDSGITCGDTEATLKGSFLSGQSFEGTDLIKTVGCGRRDQSKKTVGIQKRLTARNNNHAANFSSKQ